MKATLFIADEKLCKGHRAGRAFHPLTTHGRSHCLTYTVAEPVGPELIAVQFCNPWL
jgi:hypothetical protein